MQFGTRTPSGPHSQASVFVRWMMPALATPYAERPGKAPSSTMEDTLTIEPERRSTMWRPAARQTR